MTSTDEPTLTAADLIVQRDTLRAELANVDEQLPIAARRALLLDDPTEHAALKRRRADLQDRLELIEDALPGLQRQEAAERATVKAQVLTELDRLLIEEDAGYRAALAACDVAPLNDRARGEAFYWAWRRLIELHQDIALIRHGNATRIPRWLIYFPDPLAAEDIACIADLRKAKPPLVKPWQALLDRLNPDA